MNRLVDFTKGLLSLILVLALLVGVPAVLLALVGFPLPTERPSIELIRNHIEDGDIPDAFLIKSLAVVVWFVWAQIAVAILVEAIALVRGRISRRAPVVPGVQTFVGKLVASTVLLLSAFATPRSTVAAPITPPAMAVGLDVESARSAPPAAGRAGAVIDRGAIGEGASALTSPRTDGTGAGAPVGTTQRPAGTYTTGSGDNWWDLAEKLLGDGMRWSELRSLNSGRTMPTGDLVTDQTESVRGGWRLLVPADADPRLLDDPSGAEPGLSHLLRPEILVYAGPTGAGSAGPNQPYQVVEGDNLWDIADRHLGDPFRWPEIFEASTGLTQSFGRQITDPNLIWPDSILLLPGDATGIPSPDAGLVAEVVGGQASAGGPSGPEREAEGPAPVEADHLADPATGEAGDRSSSADEPPPAEDTPVPLPPTPPAPPVEADLRPGPGPHPDPGPGSPGPGQPDDTGDRLPSAAALAMGSGTLLVATGLVGLLRRARRLRLAETGEASVPGPPPLELVDIETVLRQAADGPSAHRLLSAVASLGAGLARPDEPAPTPEVLRVVGDRLQAIVYGPAESLPDPWRPVVVNGSSGPGHQAQPTPVALPHGRSAAAVELTEIADSAGDRSWSPAPTLVTLGGGTLINLEAVGTLGLGGPAELVAASARALVDELVTGLDSLPPAQPVDVWVADHLPGLDSHPLVHCAPLDRVRRELEQWTNEAELGLAAAGATDPWAVRSAGRFDILPNPTVVVVDGDQAVDGPALVPLLELAQDRRLPLAIVLVGPRAGWTVEPALTAAIGDGIVELQPLGLAATFRPLDLDLLLGVEALIDRARRSPIVPRPDPVWHPVDLQPPAPAPSPMADAGARAGVDGGVGPETADPAQLPTEETPEHEIVTELPDDEPEVTDRSDERDVGLLVRVLGPVEIEGERASGLDEEQRSVLAFLAVVGPSSPEQIRTAVWPAGDVDDARFHAVVAGLSAALGPLFPLAGDGRHRVRSTVTDLGSARRWIAQASAMQGERARNLLQLALSEVRGRPFSDVGERRWQWVEDHQLAIATQASSLLLDAAFDLCDQAYEADDLHLARWACEVASLIDPLQETTVVRRVQLALAMGAADEADEVVERWEQDYARSAGRPAPGGPRRALRPSEELAPHAG